MNNINYKNYLILFLMYALEFLTINLVNFYIYNSVIDLSLFNFIIFFQFVMVSNKRNLSLRHPLYIINILLLICIPVILFLNKPNFTYNQSKKHIINNETNKKLDFFDKRGYNISMVNSPKFLVKRAYILFPRESFENKVYIFNPIDGSYYISNLIN